MSPTFRWPKTLHLRRQPKYPQKSHPLEKQTWPLCRHQIPPTTKSAVKKTDSNTLVFTVDVGANEHQTKQAVKKL